MTRLTLRSVRYALSAPTDAASGEHSNQVREGA